MLLRGIILPKPTSIEGPNGNGWRAQIVALLFIVALINYFDRQSLSVIAPLMQAQLHISDRGYGHVVSLFLFASAIAYALAGFLSDRLGAGRAMAIFVAWWSLAEASTAFASSLATLCMARFCLGLGEPGLWVAAPKAIGESFPKKQRGLAIGICTLGATLGAVVALPIIAVMSRHLAWRFIFLFDGLAGLLWLPLWLWWYPLRPAKPESIKATDCHSIENRNTRDSMPSSLHSVLARAATWKLLLARSITDPVWYFYLFWFPKYLLTARHLTLAHIAHIGWMVYLGAGAGTLAGGLATGILISRGMRAPNAYRWTMLGAATLIPLSPFVAWASSDLLAVAFASIIAFAHMAWLVTLTATVVELYPSAQVGKALGLIAAGSGFGGMLSSEIIGYLVVHGGYTPVFLIMAILHPVAIVLLWSTFARKPAPQTVVGESYQPLPSAT